MPSTKPDIVTSVESVRTTANFFDEVIHKLEPKDLRQGADIVKFANKHRIKIPSALDGFSIKYDAKEHLISKRDLAHTIVLELPPREAGRARAKTISGCFDIKKGPLTGKVCVKCTISWTSIRCEITITITIGL